MQNLAPDPSTRPLSLLRSRRTQRQSKAPAARCYSRTSESSVSGFPHPLLCRIGGLRRGRSRAEQPAPSADDRPSTTEWAEQNSLMQTLAPGPWTRPLSLLCRWRIPRQFKTPAARCHSRKSESSATGLPHPLMRRIGGLRRGWNPRNKYTQSLAFARIRTRSHSHVFALARIRTYSQFALARIRAYSYSLSQRLARIRTYSQ